jgi:hypothetical protein
MALAGLPGARPAYQPVITLTSQGPEPPKQHDMSCSLSSTRLSIRIIPQPAGALTADEHPPRHADVSELSSTRSLDRGNVCSCADDDR